MWEHLKKQGFILVITFGTQRQDTASQRHIQTVKNYFSFDMRVCWSLKNYANVPKKPLRRQLISFLLVAKFNLVSGIQSAVYFGRLKGDGAVMMSDSGLTDSKMA